MKKVCPLITDSATNYYCKGNDCMFFLTEPGFCSIAAIPGRLDALCKELDRQTFAILKAG